MQSTRKPTIISHKRPRVPVSDTYPLSLAILGEPISKSEFELRARLSDKFITSFMDSIRSMTHTLSLFSGYTIDKQMYDALSEPEAATSPMKAWHVVAWHTFFEPYVLPARKHHISLDGLIKIIERSADAYYLYAVFVLKEPSLAVYNKLKTLHPEVASKYANHCKNFSVAKISHRKQLDWLLVW